MDYSILKYQQESGIGILTISKPESLNALNSQFFKEFSDFIDSIQKFNDLKVLIITGEGKAFVAGADISEMQKMGASQGFNFSKTGQTAFNKLVSLEIPVIAAINGFALGGGCELAMACDFRIASLKAKFGMPEVSLGLIPGYGGTQRLSRLVGLGDALYLILTGQIIDSTEALRMGLVQKLVEPEMLMTESKSIATRIAEQSPIAIKAAKKAIHTGYNVQIDKGFDIESDSFSKMFEKDGPEGMVAFLEKRKPNWN